MFSLDSAVFSNSSFEVFMFILMVSLTLPFTWIAISFSWSSVLASSYFGHGLLQIGSYPIVSFNSSVICGAIGFSSSSNIL